MSPLLETETLRARGGNYAQLLHQAQLVHLNPILHHLAVRDAPDVNVLHLNLLPRGRNALKITFVSAREVTARNNLVVFGKLFLKGNAHVREGGAEHTNDHLEALESLCWRGKIVVHITGSNQFIKDARLILVDALFENTTDEGFVFLRGH